MALQSAERRSSSLAAVHPQARNSPPIQPGERAMDHQQKLPSFDEFLSATIPTTLRTPPKTPTQPFSDARAHVQRARHDTVHDISQPSPSDTRSMTQAPSHHQIEHRPTTYPLPPTVSQPFQERHYSPYWAHHPAPSATPHIHPPQRLYDEQGNMYLTHAQPVVPPYGAIPAARGPEYDVRFHNNLAADLHQINGRRARRGNLPKDATNTLKRWFDENRANPYPGEDQKNLFSHQTGLTLNQISNWFINARRRAPFKDQRDQRKNASRRGSVVSSSDNSKSSLRRNSMLSNAESNGDVSQDGNMEGG